MNDYDVDDIVTFIATDKSRVTVIVNLPFSGDRRGFWGSNTDGEWVVFDDQIIKVVKHA